MTIYLGDNPIAGLSERTKYNAHHLLDFKWSDCIMNDVSWLRADTFSWQDGGVYVATYNHLVADLSGTTAATETIGSYTITYYRATDGHKIVLADQETTVSNIYSETGVAWYYILDTTNTRFKFPRSQFGFTGLRTNPGDYVEPGLPNITGKFPATVRNSYQAYTEGAFAGYDGTGGAGGSNGEYGYTFDASRSSSIYGNSTTVQTPATQMYLYFYVGDFSTTATEQTAGLNSELFNEKLDIPTGRNQSSVGLLVESYSNGASWYRVYSDGWCEQGGEVTTSNKSYTITFLKAFSDTNYYAATTSDHSGVADGYTSYCYKSSSSQLIVYNKQYGTSVESAVLWEAKGYIN